MLWLHKKPESETVQVVIVNSGIANACTGTEGYGYCEETAKAAAEGGFDYFTTTLSISPHKNAQVLNEIGWE